MTVTVFSDHPGNILEILDGKLYAEADSEGGLYVVGYNYYGCWVGLDEAKPDDLQPLTFLNGVKPVLSDHPDQCLYTSPGLGENVTELRITNGC